MKISKFKNLHGLILLMCLWSCDDQRSQELLQSPSDNTHHITEEVIDVREENEDKTEIPHYLRKDNFTVFRVIIINEDSKMLMVNDNGHWGMPWVNFTKRQFQKEAIDSMAAEYGIEINDLELRGQFCLMYDYKPTVTFRNYYVARYVHGDIKIPSDAIETKFQKVEWVDIPTAIERNGVTAIKQITRQILDHPEAVWAGSFMVSHTDTDHPTKQVEDFYPLFKRF